MIQLMFGLNPMYKNVLKFKCSFKENEMTHPNDHYFERTKRNHYWVGGIEAQLKISELRVGIAGLGGMGSGVAIALARLGVKRFHLTDPDHVDVSNFNRQVIANIETVGQSKIDATVAQLLKIDQEICVEVFPEGLTRNTVQKFCDDCDVLVDEIDVYPLDAHEILHREAISRKLSLYSAYVIGLGIHLYHFSGDQFKFSDFISPVQENSDFASGLMDTFLRPRPSYLSESGYQGYHEQVLSGAVPIFGASCLLGHSLVAMRLVFDWLNHQKVELPFNYQMTPVMPKFLVVDPITMNMSVHSLEK
jgi:molybdopterin/thiamine biosynthesis adenylyltransferase